MRKKIIYSVWLILAILTLGWMLLQWQEVSYYSNQVGLRYQGGVLSEEAVLSYYEKHPDDSLQITAWEQSADQLITEPQLGRSSQAEVYQVSGNMALLFPMQILDGGFSYTGDKKGCVISSGLAWTLFGATGVVGAAVEYNNATYLIRGVFKEEEAVLAIYQNDAKALMSNVELWDDTQQVAAGLVEIQSSLSLYGEMYQFAGSLCNSAARLLLGVPYFLIVFLLLHAYRRKAGRIKEGYPSGRGDFCRTGIQILAGICLLAALYIGIRIGISFTSDFIPSSWSDFGFFITKIKAIFHNMSGMRSMLPVFWETRVLTELSGLACSVLLFCAEIILCTRLKRIVF